MKKSGNVQKLNNKRVLQREAANVTQQLQAAIAAAVAKEFPSDDYSGREQQQAANRILHHVVEYLIDAHDMSYSDEFAQCIPDVTRLRSIDYDDWLDEGRARDERTACWRGVVDQHEGRTPYVNKERVKLVGRTDTGAWHRALEIAMEALEKGVWLGHVDLWIHDAYEVHRLGAMDSDTLQDMRIWRDEEGLHIAVPDSE